MSRKILILMQCIIASLVLLSCDSDSDNIEEKTVDPFAGIIPIYYEDNNVWLCSAEYEAVRIGEYLWMNRNFSHYYKNAKYNITREQLNLILTRCRLDASKYQVNLDDINKYYGLYYSADERMQMSINGVMYEGKDKVLKKRLNEHGDSVCAWRLPLNEDFQQLFGMCGNAREFDVRVTLSCKAGENPAAYDIPGINGNDGTYWFSGYNTNKYGFNMMPGGARFHSGSPWSTCFDAAGHDCVTYNCDRGDFYGFFVGTRWGADAEKTISIFENINTTEGKLWHWLNVRWCRRLTDKELGYKLYINTAKTDIKKLDLDETPPSGYSELAKGYLRGFYVQYILNNPQPLKSVSELVRMTEGLR